MSKTIPFIITIALVLFSFVMIVAVPVIAAETTEEWGWEGGYGGSLVYAGAFIWSSLVILAGLSSLPINN